MTKSCKDCLHLNVCDFRQTMDIGDGYAEECGEFVEKSDISVSYTTMKPLEKMKLNERLKLYAEGDLKNGVPRHSFDFTEEDEENIMGALRIVWLLSRTDFVHNYQHERKDIADHCNVTNGIIRIAKRFVEKCPLKVMFRLDFEKEEETEGK